MLGIAYKKKLTEVRMFIIVSTGGCSSCVHAFACMNKKKL